GAHRAPGQPVGLLPRRRLADLGQPVAGHEFWLSGLTALQRVPVVAVRNRIEPVRRTDRHREMEHVGVRLRAVPVLLAGRDVDRVAGGQRSAVSVARLDPTRPAGAEQHLCNLVSVPVSSGTGLEEDVVDHHAVLGSQYGIRPHTPRERRPALFGRSSSAAATDPHFFPPAAPASRSKPCRRTPPATSPIASTTRLLICLPYPSALARSKAPRHAVPVKLVTPSWRSSSR